jgi:hypothetical protein
MLVRTSARLPARTATCIGLLSACLTGCAHEDTLPKSVQVSTPIVFDAPVPEVRAPLPVYMLERAAIGAPVLELLRRECATPQPSPASVPVAAPPTTHVQPVKPSKRCRIDEEAGEVELYPDFRAIAGAPQVDQHDTWSRFEIGKSFLQTMGVIDGGETSFGVPHARALKHARIRREGSDAAPVAQSPLVYVSARRRVGEYPVDGPGSWTTVVIGTDGAPRGFSQRWKKARRGGDLTPTRDAASLRREIERQLSAVSSYGLVRVKRVELVYYDSNHSLLQPAYRYVAEFAPDAASIGPTEHVVGYVSFAPTDEPLPDLRDQRFEQFATTPAAPSVAARRSAARVRVGRYVVREDRKGWAQSAQGFWDALASSPNASLFENGQLLPAEPEQFTTKSRAFVDSVDIALLEAHGAPLHFATKSNCCDVVSIDSFAFPKLGARAGGRLKHWILHSCSAVPGPHELTRWSVPWWNVFEGGVYSVLGYRSPMLINDNAAEAFGRRIGAGDAIVPAWFSAVTSLNAYGLDASAVLQCGGETPLGRPSAISACGTAHVGAADAAEVANGCLDAWWIEDGLISPGM